MNRQAPPDPDAREPNAPPPIPLPDLSSASNDDEREEPFEFPCDVDATGGAFWAEALRDAATPTMESAKLEELVDSLGKDPGVQDKLGAEDDLEFGD
ncbi:MAG: hypothetical protein IJM54_08815 [Thermoguttaceae bacterium]|nr:hypothetical protein [Thermoguttaceae bacterium]